MKEAHLCCQPSIVFVAHIILNTYSFQHGGICTIELYPLQLKYPENSCVNISLSTSVISDQMRLELNTTICQSRKHKQFGFIFGLIDARNTRHAAQYAQVRVPRKQPNDGIQL